MKISQLTTKREILEAIYPCPYCSGNIKMLDNTTKEVDPKLPDFVIAHSTPSCKDISSITYEQWLELEVLDEHSSN
jgi:hypothetical protein